MAKKAKLALCVLALVLGATCLMSSMQEHARLTHLEDTYSQAELLVQRGAYDEALDVLEGIDDTYRNVKSLMFYSRAHLSYDLGKIPDANRNMFQCEYYMASDETMPEEYESFRATVSAEYQQYEKERQQKEIEAYRERVRTGVPFVGMAEADIANTSLGAPSSKVGHNWEWVGGERVTANIYDFYQNGRVVFSARCLSGSVEQVWDNRYKVVLPKAYSSGKSSKKKENEDDPLNAKDYLFPEDFYEDHFDDFFDFYDAEDYYYEHGGT